MCIHMMCTPRSQPIVFLPKERTGVKIKEGEQGCFIIIGSKYKEFERKALHIF